METDLIVQPRRKSGPRSRYRPKDRVPTSVTLTRFAKKILSATSRKLGESQGDVVEGLLRKFAGQLEFGGDDDE